MKGYRAADIAPDHPVSAAAVPATAALCALYSAAFALGMPGYDMPGLPFVCLIPLLVLSSSSADGRQAARRGFAAGTLAGILLVYWIAYTVAVQGRLGWALGGIAALLVSAYLGIYVSLAAWTANRLRRAFGSAGLWAFPAAWTAIEYARSVLFTGFPWLLFGYSLSGSHTLRQAADLAGVHGLGFLLAAGNVSLYLAGTRAAKGQWGGAAKGIAPAAAILAFLFVYGTAAGGPRGAEADGEAIRVGIAQGGIDQALKWDPAYQEETISIYRGLTKDAAAKSAEVVVWPETAAPFFYGWDAARTAEVDAAAEESRVPLIFGAPWFDPSGGGRYYNSVFLLGEEGIAEGRYDKRRLVPFGEYIPLRGLLFFLRKLTAGEVDFSSGTGPSVFPVKGRPVGASVCYEAIFPGIVRESVLEGATWLVNVTNDAWFGDTVAPRQHLAMARMRSVEFRRPIVRAANAGISAVFDDRGDTVAEIGLFRRGTVVASIRPRGGRTVYAKTGDMFAISCTIITFLILIISWRGTHGDRNPGGKDRPA